MRRIPSITTFQPWNVFVEDHILLWLAERRCNGAFFLSSILALSLHRKRIQDLYWIVTLICISDFHVSIVVRPLAGLLISGCRYVFRIESGSILSLLSCIHLILVIIIYSGTFLLEYAFSCAVEPGRLTALMFIFSVIYFSHCDGAIHCRLFWAKNCLFNYYFMNVFVLNQIRFLFGFCNILCYWLMLVLLI